MQCSVAQQRSERQRSAQCSACRSRSWTQLSHALPSSKTLIPIRSPQTQHGTQHSTTPHVAWHTTCLQSILYQLLYTSASCLPAHFYTPSTPHGTPCTDMRRAQYLALASLQSPPPPCVEQLVSSKPRTPNFEAPQTCSQTA